MEKNYPKWGVIIWYSFTEQINDEKGQEIVGFKEVVALEVKGFDTYKEALKYKDKIWNKGYEFSDDVGHDWAKVIRVRIINNELLRLEKINREV